mmetsp:Transcript_15253/g.54277  ORF Transcript_15253/g.54277 Transcript_15253/m.54277 type:complete len:456 (+) Transcript_15253:203-1570(+)
MPRATLLMLMSLRCVAAGPRLSGPTTDLGGARGLTTDLSGDTTRLGVTTSDLSVRKGRKWLLQPTSLVARRGRLTAVIGPSGCGKSTLLRALVKADAPSVTTSGAVLKDGDEAVGGLRRGDAGFLTQESDLFSMLTVKETVDFAYRMRGLTNTSNLVDASLLHFGLSHVSKRRVGEAGKKNAISGGERRRLCVAVELALCEAVELFACDEPTSGLDSVAAERVCKTLHDFARSNDVSVVASLHQPSSKVWLSFVDDVVVLARGGRVVYSGSVADAVRAFERLYGKKLPPHTNPAEWLLDLVVSADDGDTGPPVRATKGETAGRRGVRRRGVKRAGLLTRLRLLIVRAAKQVGRDARVHVLRFVASAGLAWFLADKYGDDADANSASRIADRVALLTFSAISMAMLPLMRALDLFAKEKHVVDRERKKASSDSRWKTRLGRRGLGRRGPRRVITES